MTIETPTVVDNSDDTTITNNSNNQQESWRVYEGEGASSGGCPFAPKHGYSTAEARREYLEIKGLLVKESAAHSTTESDDNGLLLERSTSHHHPEIMNLMADPDIEKPLYYWQLYSLLGPEPIVDICTTFYDCVYNDTTAPWFLTVFEEAASKEHHITAQAQYWIDVMGGGKKYPGGNKRLTFHHWYNANDIMTSQGASQWMSYMKRAIRHVVLSKHKSLADGGQEHNEYRQYELLRTDPRIIPCIVDFLKTKMQSYANFHKFKLNDNDYRMEELLYP